MGLLPAAQLVSMMLGWIYLMVWSMTNYPQGIMNYTTKSLDGFSIDFGLLNTAGHMLYLVYSWAGLVYPYLGTGAVQVNDILYPVHCFMTGAVILAQIFIYDCGKQKKFSKWVLTLLGGQFSIILMMFVMETFFDYKFPTKFNTLMVAGYFNTIITFVKYTPQVILNYERRSTAGLSIPFFIMDFTGGVCCLFQQFVDLYILVLITGDWSNFSMLSPHFNIIKFLIGILTLGFDLVIAFQHFVLYAEKDSDKELKRRLLSPISAMSDFV